MKQLHTSTPKFREKMCNNYIPPRRCLGRGCVTPLHIPLPNSRIVGFFLLALMLTVICMILICRCLLIHVSTSGSMPSGIYIFKSYDVNKGDAVVVNRPNTPYMQKNAWRYSSLLIKTVYGVSGDSISIMDSGVFINGNLTGNSVPICAETQLVSKAKLTDYVLKNNEYFLLSVFSPNSYDGRYFGITHKCDILYAVKPILLF